MVSLCSRAGAGFSSCFIILWLTMSCHLSFVDPLVLKGELFSVFVQEKFYSDSASERKGFEKENLIP
jgi:hypothetical protein